MSQRFLSIWMQTNSSFAFAQQDAEQQVSIRHDVRTPLPNSGQCARLRGSLPSCNVDGEGRGAHKGIGGHQIGTTHSVEDTGRRREGHCRRRHLRRLVARTVAKQVASEVEKATAPFQYALSTKAGWKCVAHIMQSLTDQDTEATVVSIDGVGAYDLISRRAMLEGLLRMERGDQIIPFVRMFYSAYLWEDETGTARDIPQGEGGEQSDHLMPLLFALGLHRALTAVRGRLLPSEMVFAFLDDMYVICSPHRVLQVHRILEEELRNHAQISLHHGKTQVWNRAGVPPWEIGAKRET